MDIWATFWPDAWAGTFGGLVGGLAGALVAVGIMVSTRKDDRTAETRQMVVQNNLLDMQLVEQRKALLELFELERRENRSGSAIMALDRFMRSRDELAESTDPALASGVLTRMALAGGRVTVLIRPHAPQLGIAFGKYVAVLTNCALAHLKGETVKPLAREAYWRTGEMDAQVLSAIEDPSREPRAIKSLSEATASLQRTLSDLSESAPKATD